jgi:hypothetical protein
MLKYSIDLYAKSAPVLSSWVFFLLRHFTAVKSSQERKIGYRTGCSRDVQGLHVYGISQGTKGSRGVPRPVVP